MADTDKNVKKEDPEGGDDVDAVVQQAEEVAAAVAEEADEEGGDGNGGDDVEAVAQAVVDAAGDDDPHAKRRFFPRVKHLLTQEWEYFLQGVLNALDGTGAHNSAAASHKASNAWYKSFHSIYGGVASDCSVPSGKNRYHKFKDKIVELWQAMESNDTYNGPLKAQAVRQYNAYRQAVQSKAAGIPEGKPEDGGDLGSNGADGRAGRSGNNPGDKATGASGSTGSGGGAGKSGSNKRSHQSTSRIAPPPQAWAHLDEAAALARLPEPLQTLIHLRHMGVEVQSQDTVLVEEAYQRALNDFLNDPKIVVEAEVTTGDDAANDEEAKTSSKSPEDLYALCQCLIMLWRCAKRLQKLEESKSILYTYHNIVQEYLQALPTDPEGKAPAPPMVQI